MKLSRGVHLAYCTNIHRGETWNEIFDSLQKYTLKVRAQVAPEVPYGIGLRLGEQSSRELSDRKTLRQFQRWLKEHGCYVFTINGFPYGRFHGTRVKEQVYAPDWTTQERLVYTNRLFDLLAELLPEELSQGSVSTVPASFKEFIHSPAQVATMQSNLWSCIEYVADLSARTGKDLHLGLEPEPLCYLETSAETVQFLLEMRAQRPNDPRLSRHLGVNYDACHLAVEFEQPFAALSFFQRHQIRLSKVHLSSALKMQASVEARQFLAQFADDVYLHQVIAKAGDGLLIRYRDLCDALATPFSPEGSPEEWRIHFHIPLHFQPAAPLGSTVDHLLGVIDFLARHPEACSHLEMETYTWEVMPPEMKRRTVVEQLVAEYHWTLA